MDEELFGGRGRALEDQFYRNRDRELLDKMRGEGEHEEALSALAAATGITNRDVLGNSLARD